jgi:hypothetical protein
MKALHTPIPFHIFDHIRLLSVPAVFHGSAKDSTISGRVSKGNSIWYLWLNLCTTLSISSLGLSRLSPSGLGTCLRIERIDYEVIITLVRVGVKLPKHLSVVIIKKWLTFWYLWLEICRWLYHQGLFRMKRMPENDSYLRTASSYYLSTSCCSCNTGSLLC